MNRVVKVMTPAIVVLVILVPCHSFSLVTEKSLAQADAGFRKACGIVRSSIKLRGFMKTSRQTHVGFDSKLPQACYFPLRCALSKALHESF